MLRPLFVLLLLLFAVPQASADNFRFEGNESPTQCVRNVPDGKGITYAWCGSDTLLINADTSDIYDCSGWIWLEYDASQVETSHGGEASCYSVKLGNYPANPGKSNYSVLHDKFGFPPTQQSDVIGEIYLFAKSEIFSVTVCMRIDVPFPATTSVIQHEDCFAAGKNVALHLPPAILANLPASKKKMMTQDAPAK